MAEDVKIDQANPEEGVMDVVKHIADNQRADAIDKLQDLLYARSSDAIGKYKQSVANTLFDEPEVEDKPEEPSNETDNGRMYPFPVLEKEVNRYNEEYVKTKRALGELGHPDGPTVNLDRVSHRITRRCETRSFI